MSELYEKLADEQRESARRAFAHLAEAERRIEGTENFIKAYVKSQCIDWEQFWGELVGTIIGVLVLLQGFLWLSGWKHWLWEPVVRWLR